MRKKLGFGLAVISFLCCAAAFSQETAGPPPLDATQRKRAIDEFSKLLMENYVFPDVAKKTANHLAERLASGAYDGAGDNGAFAMALTEDLQAFAKDRHLRVGVRRPGEEPVSDDSPEAKAQMDREWRRQNYAFVKAEILAGNVGYLDLRMFLPPQMAGETATSAMNFLGHCDAIIFDLRKNGGGDPAMIQLLSTYLFEEPTHLNDLYWRKGDRRDQFWTLPFVPGPRLAKVPVFILTSSQTFSGAEEFSNNLKVLKRATLVGETTGGGANPGEGFSFGPSLQAFIPTGRAINPTTGTNWEGTGVEPDLKVPQSEALTVAHLGALKALRAKTVDPKEQAPYDWAIQALDASNAPAHFTERDLMAFAGTYGPRKVWLENGRLVQQREGRPRLTLLPMTGTTFAAEGADHVRFTFVKDGQGKITKVVLTYDDGNRDENPRDR